ncbi:MAG: GNAT family N-acetyltransferase [Oceanicoccus sp.]
MSIYFRKATLADSSKVADILIESRRAFLPFAPSAHTDDENRHWVRATLIPEGGVIVAYKRSAIVGVIATSREGGFSWIEQLYLDPAHVGRGIGTMMMDHILDSIKKPVRLYTFQENYGARRFYERYGFKSIAFSDGQGNEERCPDILYELRM